MPTLQVPYQCLQRSDNILIAAAGSRIDLFSLEDGSLLSTWKCPPLQGSQHGTPAVREATPTPKVVPHRSDSSCVDVTVDRSSPPAKKRKLSNSRIDEPTSNSCQEKKKKQPRSDAVASGLDAPAVILLAVTKAANHVIAVTGQDKCIRVFENVIEGGVHRLKQISAR
jgi:tRNA (guanine-N(7)-)-methyltransferase subunit TRM82